MDPTSKPVCEHRATTAEIVVVGARVYGRCVWCAAHVVVDLAPRPRNDAAALTAAA